MPTGRIHVQARTGGVLPCAGVQVTVLDEAGATVGTFTTDAAGDSAPLQVEAPSWELSWQPQYAQLPYAVYDVYAQKEGFQPVTVQGVQVFEERTSLQLLEMQPLGEAAAISAQPQVYTIPRHHLADPVPRAASAAPQNAGRVLTQVVIPQYITVHLGRPSASAQDVTVTFRDYIKNVASSEIYPTWPEAALRANIYCQISLALNRVFTEWYLSKGYGFQITNSTSYDQYFVYGRNIFENISRLVDEMFATYIRRPGTIDPYYAEYCDGKSVTCPGLKQWGTVTLANDGLTPLQILQYYYGSSLELVRSANIASIPQSYPGTALRVGSEGAAVRTIQRQLNRIARDYPSFGTLEVDGVYGQSTAAAVRRFQSQFNLTADGVVGYATWYRISYVYVAVKKLAELSSEGEFPNHDGTSAAEGAWPGRVLRTGDSGTDVRRVQYWLDTLRGYIPGLPLLAVDGRFGAATAAAVRTFQAWAGLAVDGAVGRETWQALYREFTSVILEEDAELGYVTQYPGTALRTGSTGAAVRTVQFWLAVTADVYTSVPAPAVDGRYGAATTAAVRAFQQLFGLAVDGVVGPATWARLREVFTSVVLSLVPEGDFPGNYPGSPLRRGSSGQAVREMQYYLYVLSLYYPTIPPIDYDGRFGAATQAAVIAFQQLAGLAADGVVGPATWRALYAAYIRIITVEGAGRASTPPAWEGQLAQGSSGDAVAWLQNALELIGRFYETVPSPVRPQGATAQPAPEEPGAFDAPGSYGEATARAVRAFRQTFGLPETDLIDRPTWQAVQEVYALCSGQDIYGEADEAGGAWAQRVLQPGAGGPLVTQLQQTLNGLAQYEAQLPFVAVDGWFGEATTAAVRAAQRCLRQTVSGSVTCACWQAMRSALQAGCEAAAKRCAAGQGRLEQESCPCACRPGEATATPQMRQSCQPAAAGPEAEAPMS